MDSALANADVEVIAYVDEDDPKLREYTAPCHRNIHFAVGPRVGTAGAIKKLMSLCETDYMMLGSDDIEFATKNWDKHLMNAIPDDGIGLSHGADGWKNAINHPVLHRKVYELTGVFPDGFWHFGPDGYWGGVMRELGRVFFVGGVVVRHLHFRNGNAPMDETYRDSRDGKEVRVNMDSFRPQMDADVKVLKREIDAASL